MNLKTKSDPELLELYQTCSNEEAPAVKAEIEQRIKARRSQKHEADCLCSDCIGSEENQ